MKIKPEDLTIRDLEIATGLPASQWHGKCTLLSHAAQALVGGVAVYGDYCGFISKDGFWGDRSGFPNHHGWVLLDDKLVLDPTRWSFENKEPYIYIGDGAEKDEADYDEGSNRMRSMLTPSECPLPSGKLAVLEFEDKMERDFWKKMTRTRTDKITIEQAMWVANLPYNPALADLAYGVLARSGFKAFIPFDNYSRAE